MDVRFYAGLREIVGGKRVVLETAPGQTVRELLDEAGEKFPALLPLMWEPDGSLSDYIKVFVDGREMRHLEGLETVIPEDAEIDIFPPSAGG